MSSTKLKKVLLGLYQTGIDNLNQNNLDDAEKYLSLVNNNKLYINNLYFNLGVLKFKKYLVHESYKYFKKSGNEIHINNCI